MTQLQTETTVPDEDTPPMKKSKQLPELLEDPVPHLFPHKSVAAKQHAARTRSRTVAPTDDEEKFPDEPKPRRRNFPADGERLTEVEQQPDPKRRKQPKSDGDEDTGEVNFVEVKPKSSKRTGGKETQFTYWREEWKYERA